MAGLDTHVSLYIRELPAPVACANDCVPTLKGGPLYIGTPGSVRDFLYVGDHVNAYLESIKSDHANRQVFNVSSGTGTSMKALVEVIANKLVMDNSKI